MNIDRRGLIGASAVLLTQQALAQLSSPLGSPTGAVAQPTPSSGRGTSPPASGQASRVAPPASGEASRIAPPTSGEASRVAPPASGEASRVAPPTSGAQGSVPMGSGAGVHSPNSPFAPLPKRDDVLAWSLLTAVTTQKSGTKLLPKFGAPQLALHQKTQRVQGFMMPLEPGDRQRHFLLTSVPLTCSFCLPGGPESMVEVRTKTPVKYTLEPVVVEGSFMVLNDDPYGLYYRITNGVAVK